MSERRAKERRARREELIEVRAAYNLAKTRYDALVRGLSIALPECFIDQGRRVGPAELVERIRMTVGNLRMLAIEQRTNGAPSPGCLDGWQCSACSTWFPQGFHGPCVMCFPPEKQR